MYFGRVISLSVSLCNFFYKHLYFGDKENFQMLLPFYLSFFLDETIVLILHTDFSSS